MTAEELLFTVDENNQPLAPRRRAVVLASEHLWSRTAHMWVVNSQQQLLCQQRSMDKDLAPGKWSPTFGGHLQPGEAAPQAAVRELHEESGIAIAQAAVCFTGIINCYVPTRKFQYVFVTRWEGRAEDVAFDPEEVQQVVWRTPEELFQPQGEWTIFNYEPQILSRVGRFAAASEVAWPD